VGVLCIQGQDFELIPENFGKRRQLCASQPVEMLFSEQTPMGGCPPSNHENREVYFRSKETFAVFVNEKRGAVVATKKGTTVTKVHFVQPK